MDFLDDDNDEEQESYKLFGGKEGIIFLIDSTKAMFDCQQFSLAIKCAENVMKNKAISSPNDEISIILFGTKETSNSENFEHIFVVQNLKKTSVEAITELQSLIDGDFETHFGHNNEFSLADAFWTSILQFTKSKSKFQTKRLILFTSNDCPHSGQDIEAKQLRRRALIRAKDFKDHDISVELIPLANKDSTPFDVQKFYLDIFPDLKDDKCDTLHKLEQLMARIHSKSYRQRMLASLSFRFGPWGKDSNEFTDMKMSVYVYSLYLEAKKPNAVKMNRNDFKEVKSETQRWTLDSGAIVTPQEISKKFKYGNNEIFLSRDDFKNVKNFEEPGLTLLGFKPRNAVKDYFHLKPSQFIYPNETSIKGSTCLFNALLKRCVERDLIPICRLTLRRSAPPRLVALQPQLESQALEKPGGFHAIHLPFKEDIRELTLKGAEALNFPQMTEAVDLAKDIIGKLTFNYDPKNFPNPVLQTHWRTIEALALNMDQIEKFDDSQTQPNYEDIESKAGYALYSLNQLLGGNQVEVNEPKVKVYEDLSEPAKNGKLGVLTVAELKQFCKLKDIKSGSKKNEIIEAIKTYYNTLR